MRKIVLLSMLLAGFVSQTIAQQIRPRPEDHFWRRKVVNRIDFDEKINKPLVQIESKYYRTNPDEDEVYPEKDGIVQALFNGLKSGAYTALHPDTLTKVMTWEDVIDEINEINAAATGDADFEEGEGDGFGDFEGEGDDPFAGDDGFGDPDFDDPFGSGDDGGFDDLGDFDDGFGSDPVDTAGAIAGAPEVGNDMPDMLPFVRVMQFVEDRIFDKNRSDMVYDIQFIEILWVDPAETLPERRLCTFRYRDVAKTLDATQWKNRFNDAEYKSLREVFELRMFHSYIIEISGQGIKSLPESDYRRQQLVEFEHHLWSY